MLSEFMLTIAVAIGVGVIAAIIAVPFLLLWVKFLSWADSRGWLDWL